MIRVLACCLAGVLTGCASIDLSQPEPVQSKPAQHEQPKAAGEKPLQLGNFSVSLNVKDLAASRAFYEKLGFKAIGGDQKTWLILQNDTATIGLFQGMFDKNTLTFNPGWDRSAKTLPAFEDVREIQKRLKAAGITITTEADPASTGPAFITLVDPDGNPILIDQHVPRP
jgi:catechol 2,3-dioxygenase-like lactoylglutathione lyase family enzyme